MLAHFVHRHMGGGARSLPSLPFPERSHVLGLFQGFLIGCLLQRAQSKMFGRRDNHSALLAEMDHILGEATGDRSSPGAIDSAPMAKRDNSQALNRIQ